MAKQTAKITSITEAAADKFNKTAAEAATLTCDLIPGFLLRKLPKSCAWRYRYTDPTGKRRVYTFAKFPAVKPTKAAMTALDWYQRDADPMSEAEQQRQERKQALVDSNARTLRNYLQGEYKGHMKAWKPKNAKANEVRFSTQFPEFMDRDLATLTKQDLKRWQARQQERGLAHSTVRRDYAALRALINQAVADELLTVNPLQGHRLSAPAHSEQQKALDDPEKGKRRLLTPAEVQGILTGLDKFAEEIRKQRRSSRKNGKPHLPDFDKVDYPHWFIPFCQLGLATGWRPGDLYTVRWEEIDLKFSGTIRKYAEKSKDIALRREKEPTLLETPLPASAKSMLKAWHQQQGTPDTGLVFPSERGSKSAPGQQVPMVNTTHLKPWKRVKELGEVPAELQFYALRHHAISAMVAGGIPLLTVAKLVGHKDASMISRHYAHLCPTSAAEAMDVIQATIGKAAIRRKGVVNR